MGLLKKKSNQSDKTDVVQSTHPAKKKKNELFRVFDESVWESAHEDFKANNLLSKTMLMEHSMLPSCLIPRKSAD